MKKTYLIYEIMNTGNLTDTKEIRVIEFQPAEGFLTNENAENYLKLLYEKGTDYGFLKKDHSSWYKYTILPIFSKK